MTVLQLPGALIVAVAMISCSSGATASRPAPLAHTFESPEAVARAVLDRLAAGDVAGLKALALSKDEFRAHAWPELPASRPVRNLPFDYVWAQMKARSDGSLARTARRWGGRRLTFIRTRYTGETTPYATFVVMRGSEVVAADESGRELVLRLFGAALRKDGRYKVFSFVTDD